jgi:hypothetical protein
MCEPQIQMRRELADMVHTALDSYIDRLDEKRLGAAKAGAVAPTASDLMPYSLVTDENGAEPLDFAGTRRAPRFAIDDRVIVRIDRTAATIVNLSLVGAQVLSETILRPNQRVRFAFAVDGDVVRLQAVLASVKVELFNGLPRYRACVEFLDADFNAVQRLIDAARRLG